MPITSKILIGLVIAWGPAMTVLALALHKAKSERMKYIASICSIGIRVAGAVTGALVL